jgi:hypothetical protein
MERDVAILHTERETCEMMARPSTLSDHLKGQKHETMEAFPYANIHIYSRRLVCNNVNKLLFASSPFSFIFNKYFLHYLASLKSSVSILTIYAHEPPGDFNAV